MRMQSGITDQVIYFVAVDATDLKTRETGLTTFTVYRSRNGGAATAMTTPTVTEVDASNMPGLYKLLLDEDMTIAAGNDSEEMCYHVTQASMAPVTRTIELYRPIVTAGTTLTVASGVGEANTIQLAGTAQSATDLKDFADAGYDPATNKVQGVVLCDTTTANTDMVGTNSAALASVCTETRLAALTDWLDGGRLDLLLDAVKAVTDVLPDSGALTAIGADTARLTAVRAAVLTDWINGGRLDLILDATKVVVDAIPTTAMRGTDSAATAANLATVDTVVDTILADTGTDGVALSTAVKQSIADTLLTRQMTEAYNIDGAAPTVAQAFCLLISALTEFAISGTTITAKKLDGSTTAATYTIDSATDPTSRTRAT